jgi:hypothetical protein
MEAKDGMLDEHLLKNFVEAKVFEHIDAAPAAH